MVWQLDDDLWFPDPRLGDDDGCLAFGGDLSVDRLLLAYQHGIFPWFAYRTGEPVWYCPMQRFVIFPDEIHVSHSMRTLMNKGRYRLSLNEDFEGVISNCSQLRIDEDGAWLGPDMMAAYTELHHQGFAASVTIRASPPASRCGRANGWSVASMVSTSAPPSSAKACSHWYPVPRNWPLSISPIS